MSDTLQTLERLLQKSNELKNGPERIAVLEEAVRLADDNGHLDEGFQARLTFMEAATFGGRPDLLLDAFAWCLGQHDLDPDRFDQKDLLWKYKWVVGNSVELPHISRAQIESMLSDMARRFENAGSTLHAVHQTRREVLFEMGDFDGAERAAAELTTVKRDWLSDCRACIDDCVAGQLATQERDAEALEAAAPILAGRVKCTHVPYRTYARLLLPLLRLGRVDEALAHHQEGYRLIGSDPEFLHSASRHLEFVTLTGNLDQAVAICQDHLPNAIVTPSLNNRMHFYGAVRLLLETLLENGASRLRLRLPAEFALFEASGTYDVKTMLAWCDAEVDALAARFDARNGNDHYARWFAQRRNLKSLAVSAPLQEADDY